MSVPVDVAWEGNGGVSVEALAKKLTFNEAQSADEVEINNSARAVTEYLQQEGYFDAHVTFERVLDQSGNVLLEGRLTGPMLKRNGVPAFQVWLDAPLKVRAERISKRDGLSIPSAVAATQAREKVEWDRYFEIYGIDLRDTGGYDLVIDTSDKTPEAITQEIIAAVKKRK